MKDTTKEFFKAIGVVIVGLLAFMLMFVVIGLISILEWDILTRIAEYIIPIGIIVYIYHLFKIKTK